jgi:hypothetical protein
MTRTLSIALLASSALLCAGCSPPLLTTPGRFIELGRDERGDFDYRTVSADGVAIGARVFDFDRDRGGGLGFWIDAVKVRLTRMGGYALLEERDVKSDRGLTGKQLRFGRDEERLPYRYWITLFVDGDTLVVVEAGGPEAKLEALSGSVEKAIASVKP